MWVITINLKFSLTTILCLIASIFGIIALITYYEGLFLFDPGTAGYYGNEMIICIILIVATIFSSFYINENAKNASILLTTIGILIFCIGSSLPQMQLDATGYSFSDFTYFINPWDLLSIVGIFLFVVGVFHIIKNYMD